MEPQIVGAIIGGLMGAVTVAVAALIVRSRENGARPVVEGQAVGATDALLLHGKLDLIDTTLAAITDEQKSMRQLSNDHMGEMNVHLATIKTILDLRLPGGGT